LSKYLSYCLNISPEEIEKKITKKTTAILATHIFGNPCNIESIEKIAKKHDLKVIYDAAHAFGVDYKQDSVLNAGDISILSFHATKLFHTIEGGALITNDDDLAHKISYMRNFGQEGPEFFWGIGINAKNSEFHAAMGLSILPRVDDILKERKKAHKQYDKYFDNDNSILKQNINPDCSYNYSYYPIILPSEKTVLSIQVKLKEQDIIPRRYFFPSLNKLNYIKKQSMPISEDIASRILCLPIYYKIDKKDIKKIAKIILENL